MFMVPCYVRRVVRARPNYCNMTSLLRYAPSLSRLRLRNGPPPILALIRRTAIARSLEQHRYAEMKASRKAEEDDIADDTDVVAFPGRRLRHFQKQGSVKETLKRTGGRVQVELKMTGRQASKRGRFRSPHWKCRNGRTPFASSNLARSATVP